MSHVLPRVGHRATALVLVTVWGSLVVLTLIALLVIALYGRDLPLAEDWLMVAPLTANEPSLLHWLWEPNNEHRIALPRLLYLGILTLAGGDFRAGMVVNT